MSTKYMNQKFSALLHVGLSLIFNYLGYPTIPVLIMKLMNDMIFISNIRCGFRVTRALYEVVLWGDDYYKSN